MRQIGVVITIIVSLVLSLVSFISPVGAATDGMSGTYYGEMTLVTVNTKFISSFRTAKEKATIEGAADDVVESVIELINTKYSNILKGINATPKTGFMEITITRTDDYKSVAKGDYIVYTNAYNGLIPALAADGSAYWIAYHDQRYGETYVDVNTGTRTINLYNKVKDAESGVTYGYKVAGGISGNILSGSWTQLWNEVEVYSGTFRLEKTGGDAVTDTAPTTTKTTAATTSPTPSSTIANDSGMRFGGMTGQVEYCLPGADPEDPDSWRLCKMDTQLPVGATIRTQEDSSAIMSFGDLSTFVLKPEAAIVLTTPPAKESKIKIVAGNIWVNTKRIILEGSMEVEMCQCAASIKGTTFVCEEIDGKSTLKVIEGTVELTAKTDGKKVMVTAGNQVTTNQNGLGPMFSFDTASETADWDKIKAEAAPSSGSSVLVIVLIVVIVVIIAVGAGVFVMKKKKHST